MKELSFVSKTIVAFIMSFIIVSAYLSFDLNIDKSVHKTQVAKAADTKEADKKKEEEKKEGKGKEKEKPKYNKDEEMEKMQTALKNASNPLSQKNTVDKLNGGTKGGKRKSKKSYASTLFDATSKNQSLLYYNSQTGSGASTVESIINQKNGKGTEYAAFLQAMNKWNLYHVYTNQKDVGVGTVTGGIVKIYGGLLTLCLYLMDGLDGIVKIFGHLFEYLNIFKYIADDNGNIPKDNPFVILQPILDVFKALGTTAKIVISMALGILFFMVAIGIGKAQSRSKIFGKGIGKILLSIMSLVLTPVILAAFFTSMSETLSDNGDVAKNTVNDIPGRSIVNDLGWIDNSLTKTKGKSNEEATNEGFVLLHDGFPKKESEVKNKIPTAEFVEQLNTGGDEKKKLDGKDLLAKWTSTDTMSATDIKSMYGIDKQDREGPGGLLGNDEKRAFQFQLAPGSNTVKAFGGKDIVSLDLNDVSVETATLAGNTTFGQVLNGIDMGVTIVGTTFVLIVLYLSMFASFIRSIWESATHWILSNFLSISALAGTAVVIAMMLVSVGSVMLLAPLFNSIIKATNSVVDDFINDYISIGGIGKQVLSTLITSLVMAVAIFITIKCRKAILGIAQDFFNRILSKLQMTQRSASGKMNPAHNSLNKMADDGMYGLDAAENSMARPLGQARDKMGGYVDDAKGLFSDKSNEIGEGLKNRVSDAYDTAKDKVSDFAGSFKGESEPEDSETQGEAIDDEIQEGLNGLSSNDMSGNLENQGASVDDAIDSNTELNSADKELQNAQNHLDDLKKNGASQADIEEAERAVDQAQSRYNDAMVDNQNAARGMARSGASAEDVALAQQESANDYSQASNDIKEAERDLASLQTERQQMVDLGATPSELRGIDTKIGQAEDKLESAKSKQSLAKEAYDANVGNGQVAKDTRNDVLASEQAERAAARSVQNATEHGDLSSKDYNKFKGSASNLASDMDYMIKESDNQIRNLESQQGALEYMKNNGGMAFAESDIKAQSAMLEQTDNDISTMQKEYDSLKASKASKPQLSKIDSKINEAKAQKAQMQTVMKSMDTGQISESAFNAQEQFVDQAYNNKEKAEQQLVEVQKRVNDGQIVGRSAMNEAKENSRVANASYTQATRTLKGLEAQKVAGGNKLSSDYIANKQEVNEGKLNAAKAKHDTLKSGNEVAETLSKGGLSNIQGAAKLAQAQKVIHESATKGKESAVKQYESMSQKVESLKAQEARGMPVTAQVNRMQSGLKQAEKQMNNATEHEKFIRKQGSDIRTTGKTMQQNIKSAKKGLQEAKEAKGKRQSVYDNVLKSGGYTKDQLDKYRSNIDTETSTLEDDRLKLKRNRREKVQNIDKARERTKKLMNK